MGFVHLGIKKKKPIDLPMQNTTFKWNKEFLFTIFIFIIKNHHGTIALSILHACSH